MISFGFDEDIIKKVVSSSDYSNVLKFNPENQEPYKFTSYAYIGLTNYFTTNPMKFLSRLAKGPPPQYRWLAWRFVAQKLQAREPGEYTK